MVLNVKLGNLFSENLPYGFRSAIHLYFVGGRLECRIGLQVIPKPFLGMYNQLYSKIH